MQPFDRIHEYSKRVCNQIRWEKAHEPVLKEIENHILDQRDAYIADGLDVYEATEHAIRQMGDPIVVGTQLDRTHRPKAQWGMLLLTMSMVIIGALIRLFLLSDTVKSSLPEFELISIIIGLLLMLIAYYTDFTVIGKYPKSVFVVIVGLTMIMMQFSPLINGNSHFIVFGVGSMPLLFPLGFVAILYATRNRGYFGIILCGMAFIILGFITMSIPSASGFFNLGVVAVILLGVVAYTDWFNIGNRMGYLIGFIIGGFSLSVWLSKRPVMAMLKIRLNTFLNNSNLATGEHYVSEGIKRMLSNSKFVGHSVLSTDIMPTDFKMPNIDTDILLTYLIYNYGWITFIGIISILSCFIIIGFKYSIKQKSRLGLFVSLSIMTTYTMQVIWYVFWNLGFQLISPMTLPLISYGSMDIPINLTLVGIMLSVFRTGDLVKDKAQKIAPMEQFISLKEGKLIVNLGKREPL